MENYKDLIQNYLVNGAILLVVGIATFFIRPHLPFDITGNKIALILSFLIPAWATLATLVWKIQTWDGQSPAEKLNYRVLQIAYCLGLILFILTLSAGL
jgi:hypothetical protein